MQRILLWKWLVSGSSDGTTRVWDSETGQEISRLTVDGVVVSAVLSSDGKWVAQAACEENYVNCGNAIIRIWDANTGKELYQLKPGFAIGVVKFTPDSKNIVMAGEHGKIQLWDLETAKMLREYTPDLIDPGRFGRAGSFISTLRVARGEIVTLLSFCS